MHPSKINETKPTSAALNVMKRCGGPNYRSMAIGNKVMFLASVGKLKQNKNKFCKRSIHKINYFQDKKVKQSNIILEAVLLLLLLRSVRNKFYIQLALPITPEIMDGF